MTFAEPRSRDCSRVILCPDGRATGYLNPLAKVAAQNNHYAITRGKILISLCLITPTYKRFNVRIIARSGLTSWFARIKIRYDQKNYLFLPLSVHSVHCFSYYFLTLAANSHVYKICTFVKIFYTLTKLQDILQNCWYKRLRYTHCWTMLREN